jgi:HK97 family phage prohead protease
MAQGTDSKKPYGDVTYADPGYQADKQKRYPIDTKDHAKAAWSYINQADNASKYSAEDLARVKSRIKAALQKFGVEVSDTAPRSYNEETSMTAVERRFTTLPVELRAAGDQPRIGGYAAKFNTRSRNLGGFVEVVLEPFFERSRGNGWPDVMARYNHDDNQLLGTTGAGTLNLRTDSVGLDYEVTPPRAAGYLVELVQRGDVRKSSFAFRVPPGGDEWTLDSDTGYPLRSLTSGILVDVAPVNTPAYVDTSTALRALVEPNSEPVAEMRRLGIGPEAALRSLALRMSADFGDVLSLAEADELRKFFIRTDNAGPARKPALLGAAAAVQLMARRTDPWE